MFCAWVIVHPGKNARKKVRTISLASPPSKKLYSFDEISEEYFEKVSPPLKIVIIIMNYYELLLCFMSRNCFKNTREKLL